MLKLNKLIIMIVNNHYEASPTLIDQYSYKIKIPDAGLDIGEKLFYIYSVLGE